MTHNERIELRVLLLNFLEEVPKQDAEALMKGVSEIERWVDLKIDLALSKAIAPHLRIERRDGK